MSLIVHFVCNEKAIFDAVTILIFDGPRSSGIEMSDNIEYNRKCCAVDLFELERIRYLGCSITLKIKGKHGDRRY